VNAANRFHRPEAHWCHAPCAPTSDQRSFSFRGACILLAAITACSAVSAMEQLRGHWDGPQQMLRPRGTNRTTNIDFTTQQGHRPRLPKESPRVAPQSLADHGTRSTCCLEQNHPARKPRMTANALSRNAHLPARNACSVRPRLHQLVRFSPSVAVLLTFPTTVPSWSKGSGSARTMRRMRSSFRRHSGQLLCGQKMGYCGGSRLHISRIVPAYAPPLLVVHTCRMGHDARRFLQRTS